MSKESQKNIILYVMSILFFSISLGTVLLNMLTDQPHFYWLISIPLGIISFICAIIKRNPILLIIALSTILLMPIMVFAVSIINGIAQL